MRRLVPGGFAGSRLSSGISRRQVTVSQHEPLGTGGRRECQEEQRGGPGHPGRGPGSLSTMTPDGVWWKNLTR